MASERQHSQAAERFWKRKIFESKGKKWPNATPSSAHFYDDMVNISWNDDSRVFFN